MLEALSSLQTDSFIKKKMKSRKWGEKMEMEKEGVRGTMERATALLIFTLFSPLFVSAQEAPSEERGFEVLNKIVLQIVCQNNVRLVFPFAQSV